MSLLKFESKLQSKLPSTSSIFYPNSFNNIYIYNDLSYVPIQIGTNFNTIWKGVAKYQVDGVDYAALMYANRNDAAVLNAAFLRLSDLSVRYIDTINLSTVNSKVIATNGLVYMRGKNSTSKIAITDLFRNAFNDPLTYKVTELDPGSSVTFIFETPKGFAIFSSYSKNVAKVKSYSVNLDMEYELLEEDVSIDFTSHSSTHFYFSTLYKGKTYIFRDKYLSVISYNSDGTINSNSDVLLDIPYVSSGFGAGISGYRKDNYVYIFNQSGSLSSNTAVCEYHKINLDDLSDIQLNIKMIYPSCVYFIK